MKKYREPTTASRQRKLHVSYQGKAIDQMIYDFMEEQGIPGMTLAIVQAPYIPRVAGYGVTDLEKETLPLPRLFGPSVPSHKDMQPWQ